jgi:pyruvate/2-oxoglutarate dehydrogenase complex dihydrolipoamide dehydrogenase (E3) component
MTKIVTDICVIGAGSGGLSVAAGAVQMGARVVLIEKGEMGGDCLNAGCVPSKALIAAAKAAAQQAKGFRGVAAHRPRVDFAAVKDHVAAVIAEIAPVDSQERFEGLGCIVLRAEARFVGPRDVQAGETRVRARRIVIATGSRPVLPAIQGIDQVPVFTNETIFGLRQRPEHLLVVGGGPIGVEMAQAHRRLGSAVTLVDPAGLLTREDPDAREVVAAALEAEGVTLRIGAGLVRLSGEDGAIEAVLADGTTLSASHVLVAAGRKVALDALDPAAGGVAVSDTGVRVDGRLRSTSNRRVYAVGDAAGGAQFTHLAGYHAGIVVRQAVLGLPARTDLRAFPRVTYADPELAHVGLTEAEARTAHGAAISVHRAEFAQNDRAVAGAAAQGFAKIIVHRGRPVGATIVGAGAGELIGFWALALHARLKLSAVASSILPYPTLSEVSKRAAGAYFSPKLFANPWIKRLARTVQRWLP